MKLDRISHTKRNLHKIITTSSYQSPPSSTGVKDQEHEWGGEILPTREGVSREGADEDVLRVGVPKGRSQGAYAAPRGSASNRPLVDLASAKDERPQRPMCPQEQPFLSHCFPAQTSQPLWV